MFYVSRFTFPASRRLGTLLGSAFGASPGRMSALCPVKFDIPAGTQPLIEFARMLLDVADVDELQFEFVNTNAVEARFRLQVSERNAPDNLLLDKSEILEDISFRKGRSAYGFAVSSPTEKILPGWLQIQMGIVERVISYEPASILVLRRVPHSFWAFDDCLS